MKIKDQALKELATLDSSDTHIVYDLILSMKMKNAKRERNKSKLAHQKVRELLRPCKGSLSEDILKARQDRT